MKYYQPYQPLYDNSSPPEVVARRQAEADHINRTTNRVVDTDATMKAFKQLLKREGIVK